MFPCINKVGRGVSRRSHVGGKLDMYWVVFINFETKLSAQHMPGSDPGRNQIPDVPPTASQSHIVQMIVVWNAWRPKHSISRQCKFVQLCHTECTFFCAGFDPK